MDGDSVIASNPFFSSEQSGPDLVSDFENEQSGETNLLKPQCDMSKKPYINQKFLDLDTAFEFYKGYGKQCGFDVRRSTHKKNKKGHISLKYFLCSKAGHRNIVQPASLKSNTSSDGVNINAIAPCEDGSASVTNDSLSVVRKQRRTTSRKCSCPAKLVLKFIGKDGYTVTSFNEAHNHIMAPPNSRQFLRCSRELTDIHKRFIVDVQKNNIGSTRAHAIFKSMSGSFENVGATKVDFKNFSRDVKKYIGIHDADMIIQKFKNKSDTSDKDFRYEYQTDSENRLTRLFWVDAAGRRYFSVYGDAVSFDATYRTNKYKMVFVPFVGIDNHWRCVTFAAALLAQESVDDFEWACEAFKKIMGSQPKCIITDQCPAMNIAVPKCFPLSKHRHCMWHIMKKFPAKLGTLFCVDSPFMDMINKFVWMDHATPQEFERGWKEVLTEFGLQDHKWLSEIYDLRHKWIPAYFNDDPMAGLLRTTSRSESSNFYFNHFVEKGDTLSEFYLCYESAIDKQRHENYKVNHDDSGRPTILTRKQIERDAADLYTISMFYRVQEQISGSCFEIGIESLISNDSCKTFMLRDELVKDKLFQVDVSTNKPDVQCSCNLYTRVGYLCKHAFFALGMCGIEKIPRHLLSDRWMKNAEERFSTLKLWEIPDSCNKDNSIRSKTKDCWFEFQGCMSDISMDEELLDIASDTIKQLRKEVASRRKKVNPHLNDDIIEQLIGSRPSEHISVLPPKQSNNKGSRKRIVSSAEKSIAGKKRQKRKCKKCGITAFHDSRNCGKASSAEATSNMQTDGHLVTNDIEKERRSENPEAMEEGVDDEVPEIKARMSVNDAQAFAQTLQQS